MPFVQGGDVPDRVYATNACFPYMNDWGAHLKHLNHRFIGSKAEVKRATEMMARKAAMVASKKRKHELFHAIVRKDKQAVERLLQELPSLLSRHTPYGSSPLCVAAAVGDTSIISLLLERGADVLEGDAVGATPLIFAASKGHTQVITQLLESKQGGNAGRAYLLNQTTKGGETAVMAAAKAGHTETLKSLIKAGAPCAKCTHEGVSALMLACKHDRVACAQVLIQECGLKPADQDIHGHNSLAHAAAGGAVQAVQLLLGRSDLDVSQPDMDGLTPIHHACNAGSVPCLEALSSKGGKLDAADARAGAAILAAASKGGSRDVVSWLLSKGIGKASLTESSIQSPLFAAVRGGSLGVLDVLLASGARLEIRDKQGRTPLAYAAYHGLESMCKALVSRGADLLALDVHGQVPRQVACKHRKQQAADKLSTLAKARLVVPDDLLEREAALVAAAPGNRKA